MKYAWNKLLALLAVLAFIPAAFAGGQPLAALPEDAPGILYRYMALPDGTKLFTTIELPDRPGPFPVKLIRTPYRDRAQIPGASVPEAARKTMKFAVVTQDVRGTGRSGGIWHPWRQERADGVAVLEWLLKQDFCNGKIVTSGGSYLGGTQFMLAGSAHPALVALNPDVAPWDFYRALCNQGGVYQLYYNAWLFSTYNFNSDRLKTFRHDPKMLPLCNQDVASGLGEYPYYRELLKHAERDDYWAEMDQRIRVKKFRAPAYFQSGWWDVFGQEMLDAIVDIRQYAATPEARNFSRCIIGPWGHGPWHLPEKGYPVDAAKVAALTDDLRQLPERFLENMAEDAARDPLPGMPAIRYFELGSDTWKSAETWPPAGSAMRSFYLAGGQDTKCLSESVNASAPDTFVSNPEAPAPWHGGRWVGGWEQSELLARQDVLVYRSAPLETTLTVAGRLKAEVYFTCDKPDTDLVCKVMDEFPDGKSYILTEGIQRARSRNGEGKSELLEPGKVYRMEVDLNSIAIAFRPGHRIVLAITGEDFPLADRNHHTGLDPLTDTKLEKAVIQIVHDEAHPSRLMLPVMKPDMVQ